MALADTIGDVVVEGEDVIICVIGPHGGEAQNASIARKASDIAVVGRTFWYMGSAALDTPTIQRIGEERRDRGKSTWCYFISPASKGGAKDTKSDGRATHYRRSPDVEWSKLPEGLTSLGGRLTARACAMTFDSIETTDKEWLHLWDYSMGEGTTACLDRGGEREREPVRIGIGRSTLHIRYEGKGYWKGNTSKVNLTSSQSISERMYSSCTHFRDLIR
tara:strand:- start:195 stop:851 length:657 start_codon:yes stop_codon:yes gene_type:complete